MAEPFPEAPITWQGRDAKGNVVDVTSEVSTVTAPPRVESGAGGEQTIRLLGPFPVAFDDTGFIEPDLEGPGVVVSDTLSAGTTVLDAWAVATATFTQTGGAIGTIWIGISDPETPSFLLDPRQVVTTYDLSVNQGISTNFPGHIGTGLTAYTPRGSAVDFVIHAAWDTSGTPTGGSMNVYALIAEPAG